MKLGGLRLKKLIIFTFAFFLWPLCSCAGKQASQAGGPAGSSYQKISAGEVRQIMEESVDFTLLDVRTAEEFKENRIDGAISIPDYELKERAEAELPDKDALILVYCRSGRRSANAANELIEMGYKNIYDFGGITDWLYETTSG